VNAQANAEAASERTANTKEFHVMCFVHAQAACERIANAKEMTEDIAQQNPNPKHETRNTIHENETWDTSAKHQTRNTKHKRKTNKN
jgi:hypothetical protein